MATNLTVSQHLLLICGILCLACLHHLSAEESPGTACPPKYPAARLQRFCPPAPTWCQRLRGHGGRNWRHCRPSCVSQLIFGRRRYRVAWASAKGAKLSVFGLGLPGWHQRTLTIWRKKLYARSSRGKTAWLVVYPVGAKLVMVAMSAKPPYDCGRHTQGAGGRSGRRLGGSSGIKPALRRRLRGLRVRCHRKKCAVLLPLRHLVQQVARLRRQSHGRRRRRRRLTAALRFTLTTHSGRARISAGELVLLAATHGHRRRKRPEENGPASAYRRFLASQRKKYWRAKGWKDHARRDGHSGAGRRAPGHSATGTRPKHMNAPRKQVQNGGHRRPSKTVTDSVRRRDQSVENGLAELFNNKND